MSLAKKTATVLVAGAAILTPLELNELNKNQTNISVTSGNSKLEFINPNDNIIVRPTTKPTIKPNVNTNNTKPIVTNKPTNKPLVSPSVKPNPTPSVDINNSISSTYQEQVLYYVNMERKKVGLNPLVLDAKLNKVAQVKANDMYDENYFSHTSPTYGTPFDMLKFFGISYNNAAENIAQGYSTAKSVVEGWMRSEGHRKNILNPKYNKLGVGYENKRHNWVQLFTN